MSLKTKSFILLPLFVVLISQACSEMHSADGYNSKGATDYSSENPDSIDNGGLRPPPAPPGPPTPNPIPNPNPTVKPKYFSTYTHPTSSEFVALTGKYITQVHPQGIDNRYSAAVYGLTREMIKYETISIAPTRLELTSKFMNGLLPVQLHIAKNGSSVKRAPIAVILNPLYSGEFTGQMNRFIQYFGSKGYHVLVFMNPWSGDVTSKNPKFMIGDVWKEAEMHIEIMDQVIAQRIGKDNVSGGTLVGLSYGAFLGSIVKAYDQKRTNPVIDGPTLLLSPPHDILKSIKNLDRQIRDSSGLAFNCILKANALTLMSDAKNKTDYNDTNIDETCAKFVMSFVGFQATLKITVANLNDSKKLGLSLSQIASVTYESYMRDIAKLNPTVKETDLGHWMSESKLYGYDKFLVVASADDNINEGVALRNFSYYYGFNTSNSVLLPTGGHTGFRAARSTDTTCGQDWTTCMLNLVYN